MFHRSMIFSSWACVRPFSIRTVVVPFSKGLMDGGSQKCFPVMKFEPKLRQPFLELAQELLGLGLVLKSHNKIIGVPHRDEVPGRNLLPPCVHPQIEGIVQIDVRKQRRNTAPCGVPTFVSNHSPSSDTPALNHLRIRRSILGSAIRCWTNRSIHS
jgi:hypothetical protein